jgi:predicted lipid-binding transport protein (Tim44 family)
MKSWLAAVVVASVAAAMMVPTSADARRLGGGKSAGMQRTMPDAPAKPAPAAPAATPTTPAAPAAAAAPATAGATAAAAAPKRSWMGPIAGLAAGLGLAALMSHLGFGEQFADILMIALLAVAAVFVVRLLLRRFAAGGSGGLRPAMAGAPTPAAAGITPRASSAAGWGGAAATAPAIGSALQPPLAVAGVASPASPGLPADFDTEAFERIAKMIFIRMQAANDSADLDDLRSFTTPELFASLRLDLQDRGDQAQHTDVVKVDARVLDFAEEGDRQVVSVGFQGLVREDRGAQATPFDEVWHLVKPRDDSRNWAIAGIQQRQ